MVVSAFPFRLMAEVEMKPLPVTVTASELEPATRLPGAMETIVGAGFGVTAGGSEGGVVLEEDLEPPPQPERARKKEKRHTTARQRRALRTN